ncbi:hypothetical protein [Chitinophaga sp. sic0106]|uniref:hypothetical protein n=1 Tax=Chitinophaga sp. sic0106 TaxID=2854785 RepID=UPI001C47229A|nr:hypothetical protein [Chitinophaga sp. sic0106]MBV7529545.1 hypothetical protein [Chitinophaga sp. sic0106]
METFSHVRTVIGIILSLSIAQLLKGTAKFIQHPGRQKIYWVHLGWVLYLFLILLHFWWWEISLSNIVQWTFLEYFFVTIYIIMFFVLSALLYPDDIKEYTGYEDYFYSRRKWFFGLLALTFVADVVDTLMKGEAYFHMHYNAEYPIRGITHILLCLLAIKYANRTFHGFLVVLVILYELSYILRLFLTVHG